MNRRAPLCQFIFSRLQADECVIVYTEYLQNANEKVKGCFYSFQEKISGRLGSENELKKVAIYFLSFMAID